MPLRERSPETYASLASWETHPSQEDRCKTHEPTEAFQNHHVTIKAKITGAGSLQVCYPQATREEDNADEPHAWLCTLATTMQGRGTSHWAPRPR